MAFDENMPESEAHAQWLDYCRSYGYDRQQASDAARLAFMKLLTASQREQFMELAWEMNGQLATSDVGDKRA